LTALTSVGRAILGKTSIQSVLDYLGLGEGSALPVGVPVPWPSATPPAGWLKCNGAAFSSEMYPNLARAYPTNKLPDLRGEFIRGWDDGRGVDSGRALLSTQTDEFKSHSHYFERTWAQAGFDTTGGYYLLAADVSGSVIQQRSDSTNSVGGRESRPRNIAFNYIVRAA
ncbi:phage tail protein, partial [Escherichia coli]